MDVVTDDFVTIVSNEEIIRVSLFHIRNISYGVKKKADEPDKKAEGNDKKQGKQSNKTDS